MKKIFVTIGITVFVVGIALFGTAYLALAQGENIINVCVAKDGSMRVVAGEEQCKSKETPLSWNKQGETGQDGVSGYEIVTSDRDVSGVSGALGGLSVDCPAGKKALGGGGQYVTSSGVPVSSNVTQIITTAPKADGSGWTITYLITASPPGDITAVRVYATCVTVL
jgi:hypothetical protein